MPYLCSLLHFSSETLRVDVLREVVIRVRVVPSQAFVRVAAVHDRVDAVEGVKHVAAAGGLQAGDDSVRPSETRGG